MAAEKYLVDRIQVPARDRRSMKAVCNLQFELKGKDLDALRVDLASVRGGNVLRKIEDNVRDADLDVYQTVLFSGHVGAGKTTELRWLQQELAKTKDGRAYHVVWIDASEYLDTSSVQLPEFLLAVFSALVEDPAVGVVTRASATASKLWKSLRGWLEGLGLELEGEVKVGVATLKAKLTREFEVQQKARERLRERTTELLGRIRDLLTELRAALPPLGLADVVLIVDNLEKIQLFETAHETAKNSHDLFFIEQLPVVQDLRAHIVLTVPVSLHFSHNLLRQKFLSPTVEVLPMVPVHKRGFPGDPYAEGVACLERVLAERVDLGLLFADEAARRHAIALSGGAIRDLFRIVLESLSFKPDLGVTRADVDLAVRSLVSSYERMLQGREYLPKLHHVAATGNFPVGFDDATKQQLLYSMVVLEYNGETWYDVHPLARATYAFRSAPPLI